MSVGNKLPPELKEKMKHEYITSSIDQRALAEKFGVTLQTVNRYSRVEGWVDEREKYFKELEKKALELAQQQQLERIMDRNTEHLKIWGMMAEKLKLMIIKAGKPQELSQLAQVMDKLQKGERQALGMDQSGMVDDGQLKDLIDAIAGEGDDE